MLRNRIRRFIEASGFSLDSISQIQRYPLSNHLYWLSNGKPGGHKIWSFIDSQELRGDYEAQLAKIKACDTLIALAGKVR